MKVVELDGYIHIADTKHCSTKACTLSFHDLHISVRSREIDLASKLLAAIDCGSCMKLLNSVLKNISDFNKEEIVRIDIAIKRLTLLLEDRCTSRQENK